MPEIRNGNGKLWGAIASIVLFTFGAIIGALYNQLEHVTRFVSVQTYEREQVQLRVELEKINQRLVESDRKTTQRLDKLLEFHTKKDGG